LALEVEITRSALDRLRLYAALGVPEVWRWDGETLRVCLRTRRGAYKTGTQSLAFPFLPMARLANWLLKNGNLSETKWLRAFRKWVREQVTHGWKP
jgi:Uma2 family endonuclease